MPTKKINSDCGVKLFYAVNNRMSYNSEASLIKQCKFWSFLSFVRVDKKFLKFRFSW